MRQTCYICEHVFLLLDDYIDQELAPDAMEGVREHLATCAVCTIEYESRADALQAVRERMQWFPMSCSLHDKIAQALRQAAGASETD